MALMSFQDALKDSESVSGARHLLLGNGFSIACRPDAFSYGKLFDEADFSELGVDARALFGLSGTADFEQAIEALRISAAVLELYEGASGDVIEQVKGDAEALKEVLAEVLARKHPEHVGEIEEREYASARQFLAHFDGKLYTVNYDLLLYWTLMQEGEPAIRNDDGFRSDPEDEDADEVVWDGYAGYNQRVYYLHGGLHLYDAGPALKKITWVRTGIPLIEQIRNSLAENTYPLVVTEGESNQKLTRIEHSPFLHKGLRSLTSCQGCLFMFGHSLAANDDHVLRRIEQGKFERAYVSIHGDPDSDENRVIQERGELLSERRNENEASKRAGNRRPLEVDFYAADTAEVWTRQID